MAHTKLGTSSTNSNVTLNGTAKGSKFFVLSNDTGSGFIFSTGTLNGSTTGIATERMRILSSNGNVGIGTTNPGNFRLQVAGNTMLGACTTVGHSGGHYDEIGYNVGFTRTNDNYTYVSNDYAASMRLGWDGDIEFRTAGNGTAGNPLTLTNRMIIKQNGYVGIGMINPSSLLSVNGTIRAKEVIVTAAGWPDRVFKPDYRLKPLHEVESYIKKNNHLEGIPSEKEVMTKGVPMGEMQAKLLQKLEETTLYLIEMKKENELLKARLSAIEQKVR